MKFNAPKFWRLFALLTLIELCCFLVGCTSTWLSAVSGLLPSIVAVVNAIVAFVAALQGKTVSSAAYAAIQKWQQNIAQEIANAQSIIAAIQQNASSTLIAQFQAAMQAIEQNFNSILSGIDVTDSATVAKLTQFLSLGIAAVNAVLALIPMMLSKIAANAPLEELKHYDKLGAQTTVNAVKVMKETYTAIVEEPTDSMDVNAALATLPHAI